MNYKKIQILFFLTVLLITLGITLGIFWPYLYSIIFAATLAVLFHPFFNKIAGFFKKNRSLPALITVFVVFLVILIPLVLAGFSLVRESSGVIESLIKNKESNYQFLITVQDYINKKIPFANLDIVNSLEEFLKISLASVIQNLGPIMSNIVGVIFGFFMTLFALYYLLKDGHRLKEHLIVFSPLVDKYDKQILVKLVRAVNSVMKGSILVAIVQGILVGLGFWIFGIPNPILWGAIGIVAALIPAVGTGLIVLPAFIYLLVTGHTGAALGFLAWGALLVGLIDNMLRPKLMEKDIHIHPFLIFVSVIGGLSLFGPFGFILGPLVISLLFALLDIYKQEFRDYLK